jgi:hypothetical protein
VPGDDAIEPSVELGARPHCVEPYSVPESAQPLERRLSRRGREVVEDRLRHQEVRRLHVLLGLDLCERQRGLEREVDVVPEEEVTRSRLVVEERERVTAVLRGIEQFAVVLEVESAGHSTTTSMSLAAGLGALERLEVRVGDRDHVAAAVAVEPHGTDRLTRLDEDVRLHDPLETLAPCRAFRRSPRPRSAAAQAGR